MTHSMSILSHAFYELRELLELTELFELLELTELYLRFLRLLRPATISFTDSPFNSERILFKVIMIKIIK